MKHLYTLLLFATLYISNNVFAAIDPGGKDTRDSKNAIGSKSNKKDSDSLEKNYPTTLKNIYNIAILLPFYIDKEDLNKSERNTSSISRDYYKGVLLGIDSIKKTGGNFNVYILDNARDAAGLARLKDTLKNLKIDLVLGPLLESELKKIVPYCNANKINIVSPVATLDTCMDKTYYLESNPGPDSYGAQAAALVQKYFKNQRIIMVNERTLAHNLIGKVFVDKIPKDSLHIIDFKGVGPNTFTGFKGFTEKTVLFLPSKNEIFLSSLMSKLQLLDTMDYEISVIGLYPWLYFKSLEGNVWDHYNLHLLVPFNIDYNNPKVKSFVYKFRNKFNEEPNEYDFRGFDDFIVYAKLLMNHGVYFQKAFANESIESLHGIYHFEQINNCSGYRNTGVHIIKFDDFEFKKIGE